MSSSLLRVQNDVNMKKLYVIILSVAAVLSFAGCEKRFENSIDLGVDTRRVNMTKDAQEFWLSVYSDGDWTVSVALQDDVWIVPDTGNCSRTGTAHFTCSENTGENARYVRCDITGGSKGRTVSVWIVQAGTTEKAAEVELDI